MLSTAGYPRTAWPKQPPRRLLCPASFTGRSRPGLTNGQIVTESVSDRSSWTITAGRGLPAWPGPPDTVQIPAPLTRAATRRPRPRTPDRPRPPHSPPPPATADAPPRQTLPPSHPEPRSATVAGPARG